MRSFWYRFRYGFPKWLKSGSWSAVHPRGQRVGSIGGVDQHLHRKITRFLGYSLSPEEVDTIVAKTSFDHMQKDEFSNMHEIEEFTGFFRQGRIGSWKEQFTRAQSEIFDRLYHQRMEGSRLDFDFE